MIDFDIKPYPGEDEISALKRKVYFIREVKPRIDYQKKAIEEKSLNLLPLTPEEKQEIDLFWDKYLPGKLKKLFLDYRYYEFYKRVLKDGERLCDYLPDMFYQAFVDEYFTNPQHSRPIDDKNLYDLFFHDIPRPKTIFRKIRNTYLDDGYKPISMEQAIDKARDAKEVILKIAKFSAGGAGVKFWNGAKNEKRELVDFLNSSTNIVCQEVLKQHAELNRLNATSVNTIRVMTLLFDDQVHVLSSVLRMGINGSRVDNASSGGIVCGILPNGRLKNVAFDMLGNKFLKHPQGTAFESVTIPNFSKCLEYSTSLAERLSSTSRLMSWDLAIGESGSPFLIEFNNSRGQMDFHQLCNGPFLGKMTDKVLTEVFNKSYTLNSIIKSLQ